MGCDYYIVKALYIYYRDTYLDVELSREKGYFYCNYDSDDEDYDKKVNAHIKECLKAEMKPIILYNDNNFIQESYKQKYKNMILDEIKKYNIEWSEITQIKKIEYRYERF